MILTEEHIALLRELAKRSMSAPNMAPETCEDLAMAGYVRIFPTASSALHVEITQEGKERLSSIRQRRAQQAP